MRHVPVLALDIEGFTAPARSHTHRRVILTRAEALLVETARFFIPYGNPLQILGYQSTGDGWYLLFEHFSCQIALKYALDLTAALTARNRDEPDASLRIRMRQVLAMGDVEQVGSQLLADVFSEAARFLDHPPFKGYLQSATEDAVVVLAALFYSEWQRSPERTAPALAITAPPFTPFQFADKHGGTHHGFAVGKGWVEAVMAMFPGWRGADLRGDHVSPKGCPLSTRP
ncbi:MAG: hypothetical protein H7838_04930 [Magnetococcus sp. DMHC-8]